MPEMIKAMDELVDKGDVTGVSKQAEYMYKGFIAGREGQREHP